MFPLHSNLESQAASLSISSGSPLMHGGRINKKNVKMAGRTLLKLWAPTGADGLLYMAVMLMCLPQTGLKAAEVV